MDEQDDPLREAWRTARQDLEARKHAAASQEVAKVQMREARLAEGRAVFSRFIVLIDRFLAAMTGVGNPGAEAFRFWREEGRFAARWSGSYERMERSKERRSRQACYYVRGWAVAMFGDVDWVGGYDERPSLQQVRRGLVLLTDGHLAIAPENRFLDGPSALNSHSLTHYRDVNLDFFMTHASLEDRSAGIKVCFLSESFLTQAAENLGRLLAEGGATLP